MTIPYKSISVLQAYTSSNNLGDPENLLHVRCNLFPFDISAEGSINLNFTHYEDNYEDLAAWPDKIGSNVANNA
jgi:hypothetical protein